LSYHDRVRRTTPGADDFAALYMFPGVAHCGGGVGVTTFDVLTPVMAWTETGRKPGRIGATDRFVPGRGDSTDHEWVGERLYSHGYQTWPSIVDGKMTFGR
jgi:hypothetical protein